MLLVKKILNRLNGLYYPQEYLCLEKETLEQTLNVYIISGNRVIKDITNLHLFVGYSPLILAIPFTNEPQIKIIFTQKTFRENEIFRAKDAVASLHLKKISEGFSGATATTYYEGTRGEHRFLSSFHKFIIDANNRLFNRKTGNIYLKGNLYRQVQIAYSLPRVISLISIEKNNLFNLFPTDLHGLANEQHYIISLRNGGMACRQAEETAQLVISQVNADAYKAIYPLGKNHMQELRTKENFDFSSSYSQLLQIPLPVQAKAYHELELADTFIHGIHKILLFKILSHHITASNSGTLAHIHNSYATWRRHQGLPGNYLIR